MLESSHSREHEEEADALGQRLAWSAGFPAEAAGRMLERLRELQGPGGLLDPYFSTHPPLEARVRRLSEQARRLAERESARG